MPSMIPWNPARTKVQLKLSIQRLRTLQEKKLALAKKSRREIADLVAKGRIETAKLRVEGLIQDDIYVELLELIELYVEMLQARFSLLDASSGESPEPSVSDAVCSIIYAAPRTELKELHVLREILMHKFGRNFSLTLQQSDPPPASVPPRILSKLAVFTPAAELVDVYLAEIARGYGVPYTMAGDISPMESESEAGVEAEDQDQDGGRSSGGDERPNAEKEDKDKSSGKVSPAAEPPKPVDKPRTSQPTVVRKPTAEDELAARFEKLKSMR